MEYVLPAILFLIFVAAVYFLPWIIAYYRRHSNLLALFLLNLFLGWTILGWIAALVWAAMKVPKLELGVPLTNLPTQEAERMPCPSCGESISVAAKKCRFCSGEVNSGPSGVEQWQFRPKK